MCHRTQCFLYFIYQVSPNRKYRILGVFLYRVSYRIVFVLISGFASEHDSSWQRTFFFPLFDNHVLISMARLISRGTALKDR